MDDHKTSSLEMDWYYDKRQLAHPKQVTYNLYSRKYGVMGQIDGTKQPFDRETKEQWARLMTSAPELLLALENILDRGLNRSTFETAMNAINKARGVH